MIAVRKVEPSDTPTVVGFIEKKAEFDRQIGSFNGAIATSEALIGKALFGSPRFAHALIAEAEQAVTGFAFYHYRFSSFRARPSLWLDDLFVDGGARRGGAGVALMNTVACEAAFYECTHIAWVADDRNQSGVPFYTKLRASIVSQQEHLLSYQITPALLTERIQAILYTPPRQMGFGNSRD